MTQLEAIHRISDDLLKSGLDISDMRIRELTEIERAACNVPSGIQGYIIPYYSINGTPIPFYRVKLFDYQIKYKQVRNTQNHVYFPPNFLNTFQAVRAKNRYVIITEGEKKAALLVKIGIPAVAFGGVDSWQNKIITIPGDAEITSKAVGSDKQKVLNIRVPDNGYDETTLDTSPTAKGFQELCDLLLSHKATAVIVYDSDRGIGMKSEVQRAASRLGYELRFRGFRMDKIKQLVLPPLAHLEKTAIDDFIMSPVMRDDNGDFMAQSGGAERFVLLLVGILNKKKAFPRNPNVREHVNKRLQKARMGRKDMQMLSLAVITELDARGQRMYSPDAGEHYYFDSINAKLMKAPINVLSRESLQETSFGKLLYNEFGIAPSADAKLMQWLGSQFTAEDPIEEVTTHRIIARLDQEDNGVNYQISDSQYIRVTREGLTAFDNSAEGILFEADSVKPLEAADIFKEFELLVDQYGPFDDGTVKPLENRWLEVLRDVRIKDRGLPASLCALLYHVSPWLFRWRGTQLPVELIIGESGSGKSTLMELRLDILSGDPTLRNAPQDLKDWHASVANTGGLHVTDNVVMSDKSMQQRLSDEICRLVTEPHPHVEMRKYYTNTDLLRVAVNSVFAFTAIKQPFAAADLLQRSVVLEFDKAPVAATTSDGLLTYDSRWRFKQIEERGGRKAWIAYHLYALYRFFIAADLYWDNHYKATHRLINLEQILMLTGKHVFGTGKGDTSYDWIPGYLVNETNSSITGADWAFEGLVAYANEIRQKTDPKDLKLKLYSAAEISSWAAQSDDFGECIQLTNSRKLGRYMQTHKYMLASIAGIVDAGSYANRQMYGIRQLK